MNIQLIIVLVIVVLAAAYAAKTLIGKRKAFSTKPGCEHDCGCNGSGKSLRS